MVRLAKVALPMTSPPPLRSGRPFRPRLPAPLAVPRLAQVSSFGARHVSHHLAFHALIPVSSTSDHRLVPQRAANGDVDCLQLLSTQLAQRPHTGIDRSSNNRRVPDTAAPDPVASRSRGPYPDATGCTPASGNSVVERATPHGQSLHQFRATVAGDRGYAPCYSRSVYGPASAARRIPGACSHFRYRLVTSDRVARPHRARYGARLVTRRVAPLAAAS